MDRTAIFQTLSSNDELYRSTLRDPRAIPTLLSPWEYREEFGIVHPSGCDVCSTYMQHVADASYSSHQPAFQIAFQDRKRAREDTFDKGLDRFRFERNQAREEAANLRAELDAVRVDADRFHSELMRYQRNFDVSKLSDDAHDSGESTSTAVEHREDPIHLDVAYASASCIHSLKTTPIDDSPPRSIHPIYSRQPSPPLFSIASPQAHRPEGASLAAMFSASQIGPDESMPLLDPPANSQVWTTVQSSGTKSAKTPKTIKQIQSLIKAAQEPGNYSALTKVKAMCSDAHKTPREQKTEVQRFLLTNWRSPGWENPSAPPRTTVPLNNPRLDDPVECWVAYYAANPGSCPKGIRFDAGGQPFFSDMRASRTVARIRPTIQPNDPESREARQRFMAIVTELFSAPGEYENLLRRAAYSVCPHMTYAPYICKAEEMTDIGIACHFASCGVTITMADSELGPWAREYRRSAGGD